MKIRLKLSPKSKETVINELKEAGIEISEDAQFILTEEAYRDENLRCKDGTDTVIVPLQDICFAESLGHDVFICTKKDRYKTDLRIYQLEALFPKDQFIRISNSVIIQANSIFRIRPALSCKFHLTLTNGTQVDVTRTYYYKFKDFFNL
ncbi:MAG: LytTR family transcriptional regulator [Clostridiaceae bacterium]|nr:LytTR family transcriptional regulator [Clostridiaceae bacterium]